MESIFTWDLGKEVINIQKHGVNFKIATLAFADPYKGIAFDEKHSHEERWYFCLGKVRGRVLTVRFVYRENRIRILGAGYWRRGKREYEKKNKNRR